MKPRQRGFTLIELMVVIAIIGVFLTLGFSMSAQEDGANGNTVSDQVVSQLQFARQRAVATRRYHEVIFTANKLQILEGTNAAMTVPVTGMAPPGGYRVIQEMKMPSRVTFFSVTSTIYAAVGNTPTASVPFTLVIRPDGSATTGMTAFITDQSQSRRSRVIMYSVTGSAYARNQW